MLDQILTINTHTHNYYKSYDFFNLQSLKSDAHSVETIL